MDANCQVVEYGSPLQVQSIDLRRKVLRIPLGLDFKKEELEAEKDQVHIVCTIGSTLAGVLILVKITDIHVVKMRQVAVDNNCQGKGIGRQMVRFSEKWAVQNNYNKIILNARITAAPFYLSMDYRVSGNEFMEVGIPHVQMVKELG
jgi:predicted GNAT family N-acyltransferase